MTPPPILGTLESALYVDDLDKAEAFYGQTLGLAIIARQPGRHVFFRTGDSVLLVFNAAETLHPPAPDARLPVPPHGASGPAHYCLKVAREALEDWRGHLTACGIEIEADFAWPNGARSIYLRDPAGNSLELAEPALWFSA